MGQGQRQVILRVLPVVTLCTCLLTFALIPTGCGDSHDSGDLVGKWVAQENTGEGVMEFTSEGACVWDLGDDSQHVYSYEVDGDDVLLTNPRYERTVRMPYRIDGDVLYLYNVYALETLCFDRAR